MHDRVSNLLSDSAIVFPSDDGKDLQTFEDACELAVKEQRPIVLKTRVELPASFVLRKQQSLVIRGEIEVSNNSNGDNGHPEGETNEEASRKKPSISGNLHTLFILNNSSSLTIYGVDLFHTREVKADGEDHRDVGAAINVRNKATLTLRGVVVSSVAGFCCWIVKKASMQLDHCVLTAKLRSAVVCFGQTKCHLAHCTVQRAGVHGICARGNCQICLQHCNLIDNTVRAVYAYANASLELEYCRVSGTIRADKAAIEVSSASIPNQDGSAKPKVQPNPLCSKLSIRHCHIFDNHGAGIRLKGPVDFYCPESITVMENNRGANVEKMGDVDDCPLSNEVVLRDSSGSSFRQGDWWCSCCAPRNVVIGGVSTCPKCGNAEKGPKLSEQEIICLNRGMDIREQGAVGTSSIFSDCLSSGTTWWFDGDDKGWIQYDEPSSERLEDAYIRFTRKDSSQFRILLSGGKYEVDLESMQQINLATQFLRYVRRRM